MPTIEILQCDVLNFVRIKFKQSDFATLKEKTVKILSPVKSKQANQL